PIAIGIPYLYPWSHPELVRSEEILRHKQPYLNLPFFLGRTVLYFAGWIFLAWRLNRWSDVEDREGPAVAHQKMATMSGPGLLFWGFSVTFMAIDWIISTEPRWFSTIFGLLIMAGQGLSSMAFLIALLVLLAGREPLRDILTPRHLHDLGKLLLANV